MLHSRLIRFFSAVVVVASLAACGKDTPTTPETPPGSNPETPPPPPPPPPPPTPQTEGDIYLAGAKTAWAFVENNTQSATGLAKAHYTFQYVTAWDIASQIGATYSAHELGIINDATYDSRIQKILSSLNTMPLFENTAFNRFYDAATAKMVRRDFTPSNTGYGWSTTDIGRLLTWLRVLSVKQPQYASQAQAIVNRLNYSKLIVNGTLQGVDVAANGTRNTYAETGLGYEQYAAGGFALWGKRASNSLSPTAQAGSADIYGVSVPIDKRGTARITSEPYFLIGLEQGWWNGALKDQAQRILSAQQARYDKTGTITIVTEDALPDAPYFFYYYSVFHNGRQFVVEGPDYGTYVENPRWVSAKGAFAWRAIFPTDYTLKAFTAVQPAAIAGQGWGAGVYEGTLKPTGEASLNTAAIVLEAALYQKRGQSFLSEPIS